MYDAACILQKRNQKSRDTSHPGTRVERLRARGSQVSARSIEPWPHRNADPPIGAAKQAFFVAFFDRQQMHLKSVCTARSERDAQEGALVLLPPGYASVGVLLAHGVGQHLWRCSATVRPVAAVGRGGSTAPAQIFSASRAA